MAFIKASAVTAVRVQGHDVPRDAGCPYGFKELYSLHTNMLV